MENGYEKEKIKEYHSEKQPRIEKEEDTDKLDRGTATIPHLKGLQEFSKGYNQNMGFQLHFDQAQK